MLILKKLFNQYLKEAMVLAEGKASVIQVLNRLDKTRHQFAAYLIDSTHGSCCRRGSQLAEVNHSSVIHYIGKDFTGELEELLIILLNRQKHHYKIANDLLVKDGNEMRIIVEKLKNNSTNPLLLEAANFLNSSAYKSFLTQYEDSVNYQVQEEDDGTFIVYRIGFSHSPRRFKERTSRCTCKIAVAYEQQCKHEIVLNNGFQIT